MMKILVLNCGSSSLKYQLIDMSNQQAIASGLVERIGLDGAILTHRKGADKFVLDHEKQLANGLVITNHKTAVALVIKALTCDKIGIIKSMDEISAVGHRVVHGGEKYASSVIINADVMKVLNECSKLAPLHNPANITGIMACQELMPTTPMVAVFDTAFHQTMPVEAYIYSLPYEIYTEHKVRRYGFHGTSHKYVANEAAKLLGKNLNELKIITCHLGNGASVAAIKHGKSVDTSMGFTPLAGLTMGTRCGDIDPSIIAYLAHEMDLSVDEIDNMMNKKSGVLGLSGISSDFRDIENAAEQGNQRAQLALDVFTYHVKKYIGAYAAAMNGVDAIVFTAGLGENDKVTRANVVEGVSFLGVNIDAEKNNVRGQARIISTADSKVTALLIPTNEELMIAQETQELI
ncbi:MAG: acetate kinase [Burkholderiales bacterium]|nr:acetate kinase [Burkholderiales bacterium]MBP9768973.1 acetate kinase [Burkholderiales bacterium]